MADNFSVVLSGLHLDSDMPFDLYLADIAVNVVFSAIAVLGNTFIMVALWKLSPLQIHSVLKVFLVSLALWLVRSTPERAVRVRALAGDSVLCYVLGQDTLLSQCLSPPRCINVYLLFVGKT